jgi:hypothetical protein
MSAAGFAVDGSYNAQLCNKLSPSPLSALVIGSMIVGSVFSLPQKIAKGASPRAFVISRMITGNAVAPAGITRAVTIGLRIPPFWSGGQSPPQ